MNFDEFRTLWEEYVELTNFNGELPDAKKQRLSEINESLKTLPLDKIFNVDIFIFRKNIEEFFNKIYKLRADVIFGFNSAGKSYLENLSIYLNCKLSFVLENTATGRNCLTNGFDLRSLLGCPTELCTGEIQAFMSYDGIEDVLWTTIKENYNSEKEKQIGLIRKRINENLQAIEKLNAPDYVKTATSNLDNEIDADNQKLQQILSTLNTID